MSSRSINFAFPILVLLLGAHPDRNAHAQLPRGFVDATDVIPSLAVDMRYATDNNFVGTRVDGYVEARCIMTNKAAAALKDVQDELARYGLGLKVFDAYRPQQAVDHFVRWSQDTSDHRTKNEFYPDVDKRKLFREGYIAARSSHSRGSTVDLTFIALADDKPGQELDMGTPFDFFGRQSWVDSPKATPQQSANRLLLRSLMTKHGFRPYDKEWWHFTLVDEPFPDTYFNFPVK